VNHQISEKIEDIFDKLGIDYTKNNDRINFSCPIHGSSSNSAYVYTDDSLYPPNWKCYSHNCHEEHRGLVGLLMGILKVDYQGCIKWLSEFDINPSQVNTGKKFIQSTKIITHKRLNPEYKISLNKIDYIKPKFYLDRGFKENTLKHFGISYCNNRKNPFFGYITVPIFNDDKKSIAGFIARNPNPKCLICHRYHKENDPCSSNGTKWKNTAGFHNNAYFYNLWNAKPYIEKFNEVILTEGPADTWKMYESGIYNCLSMFGTSITMDQKVILESLPIINIKLFLDPDEAGKTSSIKLKNYLDRFYNVEIINYNKQPSECSKEELQKIFKNEK